MKLLTANQLPLEYNKGLLARLFGRIDTAFNRIAPAIAFTKTTSFHIGEGETRVICNGSGTITVTLPKPTTYNGPDLHIKTIAAFTVVSASANVVPLAGGAAGTAILAATAGEWAVLQTNGTSWVIVEKSGGVSDGDKGDITVSASGATWTIDGDAVTYAKLQNVAVTDRILGRDTIGAGDVEELTLSQVLDFVGSAAQGDVLYRGAAAWTRLGAGTSGQVLQTGGAAANPSWATVNSTGSTPSFSAYLSTSQSVTSGLWTRINLNAEEFDTTNAFDMVTTYQFKPLVAGYYLLTGILDTSASASTTATTMAIYKNGVHSKSFGYSTATSSSRVSGSAILLLNGSSDYIEFWGYVTGVTTKFSADSTFYSCGGCLVVRT